MTDAPVVLPPSALLPDLPPSLPQRPYPLWMRALGRLILRTVGMRLDGGFSDTPRAVLVGWPHTSNLDGIVALAGVAVIGLRPAIAVKDSLFGPGTGAALRAFGGVPVSRDAPGGVVGEIVAAFGEAERAAAPRVFAISPEGTRSGGSGWKSGWHRAAVQAGVPVAVLGFDWARRRRDRRLVVLGTVVPCGDLDADTQAVEALLAGIVGRHPERATRARNRPDGAA